VDAAAESAGAFAEAPACFESGVDAASLLSMSTSPPPYL